MKLKYIILIGILLFSFGCEEDTYSKPKKDIYVDILNGNNNNTGIKSSPYKNLTYALAQVTETYNTDYTIYMSEGNYTQETGESFPIHIPSHVKIKELEENKKDVLIHGFGKERINYTDKNITLILNYKSSLKSIVIEGNISMSSIGIYTDSDSSIESCRIKESYIGIYVYDSASVNIRNSYILSNHYGLETENSSSVSLDDVSINYNKVGFFLKSNSLTTSSSEIRNNRHCNLLYKNSSDLHIKGIIWNTNILHLEKNDECINGNDIVEIGTGNINYQVKLKEDTLLFDNENIDIVNIQEPSFGELISSRKPTIEITPTKKKFFKIGIFINKPVVEDNEIVNKEDMVWTWDTSMKTDSHSSIQYIPFNEGKGYLNYGQHYYIALWGWDDKGLTINLSSTISYFVIDN